MATTSLGAKLVLCPDPSKHETPKSQLQEQASTAALYATKPQKDGRNVLDANNKLTSASAAASLKYAKPHELPSFPVVGIDTTSSAGKAATLAHANPKDIKWWTPDPSANAGKAALLAKEYKMDPLWQPETSAAGSKAALLAHRDGGKLNLWQPSASAAGNSAAGIAMRNSTISPPPDTSSADDRKKKALMAATGAFGSQRRRSGSTPTLAPAYPDAANSAHNALNAATVSHRASVHAKQNPLKSPPMTPESKSSALDAARVQNIGKNVPREMFSDAPPVSIEVEEQKHQDALRASAISMAKKMYAVQQSHIDEVSGTTRGAGHAGATTAHARNSSVTTEQDIRQQAMQYIGIQEAAQKLAAERLAKLHDGDAAYRDYYGYSKPAGRARLSVRRGRRRASSEGEIDSDDEEQSRRIRTQMSLFNSQLKEVDTKKRAKDRENLLAAAEKKVHAQMHSMDEKVFNDTGRMSQAMMDEWDAKARAKAAAESEARMETHGKVHIGGGKYMDRSEVDAIAAARLQPTLDDINDKAEKQRARDEEIRLDNEEKRRQQQLEREREADSKALEKRIKDEETRDVKARKEEEKQAEKVRKAEEKETARAEKDAEKARKAEEKRLAKEVKRKSKELSRPSAVPSATAAIVTSTSETQAVESTTEPISTSAAAAAIVESGEGTTGTPVTVTHDTLQTIDPMQHNESTPSSPSKQNKRGLGSLLNKLKRRSKHSNSMSEISDAPSPTKAGHDSSSFPVGSSALPPVEADANAIASTERARSPSISSLESAAEPVKKGKGKEPVPKESGVSEDEFEEARDRVDELAPPPKLFADETSVRKSVSPHRETVFREEL